MKLAILFAAMLALIGFGCGGTSSNPDDSLTDNPDITAKADGIELPTGTFRNVIKAGVSGIGLLVLKTDETFYAEIMSNNCFAPPCKVRSLKGNYQFTKAGTTRYVRLYDPNGTNSTKLAYTYENSTLKMRDVNSTGNWLTFKLDFEKAWCNELADCEAQEIPSPRCMCTLYCEENTCIYKEEAPKNACETAGGACVALVPGACADGTVGDADTYSCGGAVGVMCCLPNAATECSADEDCRLFSSYCGGCECFALLNSEDDPECNEGRVMCFMDPCQPYSAVCSDGSCILQ